MSQRVVPIGRRCGWCAVRLRWWQPNYCRMCKRAYVTNAPSPPCPALSRSDAEPDVLLVFRP